ncbi:MAG TPA: VOC family protein [Deinococcales bacterium]|nr:VOC family protein [Deinococcales bacterium]
MSTTVPREGWPTLFAVSLFQEDLEAAKRFYSQVFGLTAEFEDADSAVVRFGPTLINLLKVEAAGELLSPSTPGGRGVGSRVVFSVPVDDVDAECARLAALGVPLLNGPVDRPWGPRTASVVDPGGHVWELAQGHG